MNFVLYVMRFSQVCRSSWQRATFYLYFECISEPSPLLLLLPVCFYTIMFIFGEDSVLLTTLPQNCLVNLEIQQHISVFKTQLLIMERGELQIDFLIWSISVQMWDRNTEVSDTCVTYYEYGIDFFVRLNIVDPE